MQTYQAVVEYQRKDATVKYTSKTYSTQKEALTDLNQELKRTLKKEQTVTAAYVTAKCSRQEAQERFEKKVKELTKTLKAIRAKEPQAKNNKLEALENYLMQKGEFSFLLEFLLNPGKAIGLEA